jgi:hypothetical protein
MRHSVVALFAVVALAFAVLSPSGRAHAERLPGVIVELSIRGGADTRAVGGAPWTVQLVIRDDGSWSADGRTGQLTPQQRESLRRLASRARFVAVRATGPVCAAVPSDAYRVRSWRGSLTWAGPCGAANPHRSIGPLIAQARALTSAGTAAP